MMTVQHPSMTVEQFNRYVQLPENVDRRWELIDGAIVEKMPTQLHAAIIQLLSGFLFIYLRTNRIGWALVEARYEMPGDEENARVPDLSFVSGIDTPLVDRGAAPYMPDLAVEVMSPGQTEALMLNKARYYIENGSRLVWTIFPSRRSAHMLTPEGSKWITENDSLDGGDVLPGFTVVLGDIFPATN